MAQEAQRAIDKQKRPLKNLKKPKRSSMVYLIDTSDKEPRISIVKDRESVIDGNIVWLDIPRDIVGEINYSMQVIMDVCQR